MNRLNIENNEYTYTILFFEIGQQGNFFLGNKGTGTAETASLRMYALEKS